VAREEKIAELYLRFVQKPLEDSDGKSFTSTLTSNEVELKTNPNTTTD
jgi:hypothetical protein